MIFFYLFVFNLYYSTKIRYQYIANKYCYRRFSRLYWTEEEGHLGYSQVNDGIKGPARKSHTHKHTIEKEGDCDSPRECRICECLTFSIFHSSLKVIGNSKGDFTFDLCSIYSSSFSSDILE